MGVDEVGGALHVSDVIGGVGGDPGRPLVEDTRNLAGDDGEVVGHPDADMVEVMEDFQSAFTGDADESGDAESEKSIDATGQIGIVGALGIADERIGILKAGDFQLLPEDPPGLFGELFLLEFCAAEIHGDFRMTASAKVSEDSLELEIGVVVNGPDAEPRVCFLREADQGKIQGEHLPFLREFGHGTEGNGTEEGSFIQCIQLTDGEDVHADITLSKDLKSGGEEGCLVLLNGMIGGDQKRQRPGPILGKQRVTEFACGTDNRLTGGGGDARIEVCNHGDGGLRDSGAPGHHGGIDFFSAHEGNIQRVGTICKELLLFITENTGDPAFLCAGREYIGGVSGNLSEVSR